jgi:predicted SprT family Zn-dependent metalloprotease
MADEKQSLVFLQSLGFNGLRYKNAEEDRIRFHYTTYNEQFLIKHFGKPESIKIGKVWKFGTEGAILVRTTMSLVVLRNAKGNAKRRAPAPVAPVAPIETHVPAPAPAPAPEPKLPPAQDPNVPGAKDNDDANVPVTHLPDNLVKFYSRAKALKDDRIYRKRFMALLWHYLNTNKFGGQLKEPRFNLLKDQDAYRMRLRGRWWPGKRVLDIAPRLYNAQQNFFVEIFLHEMCHQAVSEIDHADFDPSERYHKGHGPYWQDWMRKVGLNPLRFDPNDNSTYMTEDEKEEHKERVEQRKEASEELRDRGITRLMYYEGITPATAVWQGKILVGLAVCPTAKNGKAIAFLDINELPGNSFKLVAGTALYKFSGTEEQKATLLSAPYLSKAKRIADYYGDKALLRQLKRTRRI